jgi:hypothetical protein
MTVVHLCSNTLPHIYHGYYEQVEVKCTGLTRCGTPTHDPHTFVESQSFWCRGICDCGDMMRGPHGPGDHK